VRNHPTDRTEHPESTARRGAIRLSSSIYQ
jgi:hypothetical protein